MAITDSVTAFVDTNSTTIDLSQMFSVTASAADPTYVVLTVLDRDEYTEGAAGTTGTLSGNGQTLSLASLGGDARGTGIVFAYQSGTGRYFNSTYGYLDQLTYTSSSSLDDVANLSLFGTGSLATATAYATNAYDLVEVDAAGYIGSATVATEPSFTGSVPSQATPDSIAAVAETFVGKAWNMDGCWVLASTVAAEAGAALPVQSTLIGIPGQSNGEWIVAFDGPAGQTGNWQSMVTAGEIVVIGTSGGGGHITTVVSGAGSTAMLVDNITYVNQYDQVQNGANDGSSADVIVAAPHLASQEWSGVQASSVVIYELDTPIVTAAIAADVIAIGTAQNLGPLFSVTDPGSKAITEWQVYDTAVSDSLLYDSTDYADHSAAAALTVTSLGSVALLGGDTPTTDALEVRAYNGSYWGDWDSLGVTVGAAAAAAPELVTQTPAATWLGGEAVSLAIPAGAFTDPQSEALTYSAKLSNGQALPGWLAFNAATDTFGGTAPTTAQTLSIVVTATDTSGLSATDHFSATVIGTPVLAKQTPGQTWTEGSAVTLALPANAFTDPQNERLTYTATQSNGQALPGWLSFNAATQTFSGTAPGAAQSFTFKVTATDTSGLSASESFTASVGSAGPTLIKQTPNQTWGDGQSVAFILPAGTFTDAPGLRMTFAAYQTSGPSVISWLRFNPTADELMGRVPSNATGTVGLEIIATDTLHHSVIDAFDVALAPSIGHNAGAGLHGVAQQIVPSPSMPLVALRA